jgi:hypothetical protein
MWPRVALIIPVASRVCTAMVTPERRTPSIMDKELVDERQIVPVHSVVAHQQPAGEALLDGVAAVRQSRVGDLHVERPRIAEQTPVQR